MHRLFDFSSVIENIIKQTKKQQQQQKINIKINIEKDIHPHVVTISLYRVSNIASHFLFVLHDET